MGKGIASGRLHAEITICEGCFHRHVCGDKDYLSANVCCNFLDKGRCVVLPCKAGGTVYVHRYSIADKKKSVYEATCCAVKVFRVGFTIEVKIGSGGYATLDWGLQAWATRTEAEEALKGGTT